MMPQLCPSCEVAPLREDGSCSCGYGKKAEKAPEPAVAVDAAEIDSKYMARVRAFLERPPLKSTHWADRILEREARGESVPMIALEWARKASAR